jgi:hypothetical protein
MGTLTTLISRTIVGVVAPLVTSCSPSLLIRASSQEARRGTSWLSSLGSGMFGIPGADRG